MPDHLSQYKVMVITVSTKLAFADAAAQIARCASCAGSGENRLSEVASVVWAVQSETFKNISSVRAAARGCWEHEVFKGSEIAS